MLSAFLCWCTHFRFITGYLLAHGPTASIVLIIFMSSFAEFITGKHFFCVCFAIWLFLLIESQSTCKSDTLLAEQAKLYYTESRKSSWLESNSLWIWFSLSLTFHSPGFYLNCFSKLLTISWLWKITLPPPPHPPPLTTMVSRTGCWSFRSLMMLLVFTEYSDV